MATKRWFARKALELKSEEIRIIVSAPDQFTRNGVPIAVLTDIVAPPATVPLQSEGVGVTLTPQTNIPGGNNPLFTGTAVPASTDGITPLAGTANLNITKKGTYEIKVNLHISAPSQIYLQMLVDGAPWDSCYQVVDQTLAGFERAFNASFQLYQTTDTSRNISFLLAGDTLPTAGQALTYGTNKVFILHSDNLP